MLIFLRIVTSHTRFEYPYGIQNRGFAAAIWAGNHNALMNFFDVEVFYSTEILYQQTFESHGFTPPGHVRQGSATAVGQ